MNDFNSTFPRQPWIAATRRLFVTASRQRSKSSLILFAILLSSLSLARAQTDPLPSWNDSPNKQAIIAFVNRVTKEGGPDFVSVPERIATFDNDGTLWSEQPIYFQFAFALDRVKALAPQHPEWKTTPPFKAVLDGDMKALTASGEKGLIQLLMTTHTSVASLVSCD